MPQGPSYGIGDQRVLDRATKISIDCSELLRGCRLTECPIVKKCRRQSCKMDEACER